MYPGALSREHRGGVLYVRDGNQATVHLRAMGRYAGRIHHDVVIDQINTVPFFTPFYAKEKAVAFIHQLAREVWLYEFQGIIGRLGYFAEPIYLWPYRKIPIITVSQSSCESLRQIGMRGDIRIIPEAIDELRDPEIPEKASPCEIVVLGRLTPSKRIEESIMAVKHLRALGWEGVLNVVGGGDERYRCRLQNLARELGLSHHVVFHGRVTEERRRDLLRRASVLWMTSVREGWGLAVSEAAAHGTPAVVYDVPGLRESVNHGSTGLVVPPDSLALARATLSLFDSGWRGFAAAALADAARFDWNATAKAFAAAVEELVHLR